MDYLCKGCVYFYKSQGLSLPPQPLNDPFHTHHITAQTLCQKIQPQKNPTGFSGHLAAIKEELR